MTLISPAKENELKSEFFEGQTSGFFIEVGAADPYSESQSLQFEEVGWKGVLIEPLPEFAIELRRERTAQVFNVACSSPSNAGKKMQLHAAGMLSSLDRSLMAPGAAVERIVDVPVKTLDQILIEANARAPIDFMSVDVEGHEIEVLRGMDFARWQPRLVLVEDHVRNLLVVRYMRSVGYRLLRHTHYNGWYVPADSSHRKSWPDRWRILRKYYLGLLFRKLRDASRKRRSNGALLSRTDTYSAASVLRFPSIPLRASTGFKNCPV